MNYKETVDYLYRQAPSFQKVGSMGYKEGLENTLLLDSHLKHPHRFFKSIHIAGTNGKGSTAHTLATILQKAHYKVGLYTSPHLIDFRERIRVNGIAIPEEDVVSFVVEFHNVLLMLCVLLSDVQRLRQQHCLLNEMRSNNMSFLQYAIQPATHSLLSAVL